MVKVIIRPQAFTDLTDIFDYIAVDNFERAITLIRNLHGCMEKLAINPKIGRSRAYLVPNLRSFPYAVFLQN